MTEVGVVHASVRNELTDLLRLRADEEDVGGVVVPACPDWTVHDTVAHLAGANVDVLAGRLEGVGSDAWTAAQVDARRGAGLAEVLDEWNEHAPQVEAFIDDFGGAALQYLMDALTHDADVRHALGAPVDRDRSELADVLEFLAPGFHAAADSAGIATLRLVAEDAGRSWVPAGASVEGEARTTAFELLRGLTGRRSVTELATWDWDPGPDPFLPAFTWGPFRVRRTDLGE